MRNTATRLAAFLLVALSLALLACKEEATELSSEPSEANALLQHPSASPTENRSFRSVSGGKAKTSDGIYFSFGLYSTADGRSVTIQYEDRKTDAAAKAEFRRQMNSAAEILDGVAKASGVFRTERAVFRKKGDGGKSEVVLIWIQGHFLKMAASDSIENVVAFENEYVKDTR